MRVLLFLATALLVVACAPIASVPPSNAPAASPTPRPSLPELAPDGSRNVTFAAADGVELVGRLYGTGSTAVVLAHMGNHENSQDDWSGVAAALADAGFRVLTFNRRGVCSADGACSDGGSGSSYADHPRDIEGAVAFVRAQGAGGVVIGGASIGAMASLQAVLDGLDVDGLIWVAGVLNESGYTFTADEVDRLAVPILVISAADDRYGAGPDAQQLYDWAPEPKELVTPPGRGHGTELWTETESADHEALTRAIIDFATRYGTGS